jgi:hypothetical protein
VGGAKSLEVLSVGTWCLKTLFLGFVGIYKRKPSSRYGKAHTDSTVNHTTRQHGMIFVKNRNKIKNKIYIFFQIV